MASVFAGREETTTALAELQLDVRAANFNSDAQTVIAGPRTALEAALERLAEKGLQAKRLPVAAAFHTPAMQGAQARLQSHLAATEFRPPTIPVYSNVTARPYPTEPNEIRAMLARHIVEPVQFVDLVQQMYADGARLFVEVGPGSVLTGLVRRILGGQPHVALSLDARGLDGWQQFAHLLARLSVLGLPVALGPWFQGRALDYCTTAALLRRTHRETKPKPTDWIVSPGGGAAGNDVGRLADVA